MATTDFALSARLPVLPPIAAQVKGCLGYFDVLLANLDAKDECHSLLRAISDASGRFKIWSSNIGAHHAGRRSLDHRLRDASHLQEHVLRLLSSLAENLNDGKCTVHRMCWQWLKKPHSTGNFNWNASSMGSARVQ